MTQSNEAAFQLLEASYVGIHSHGSRLYNLISDHTKYLLVIHVVPFVDFFLLIN